MRYLPILALLLPLTAAAGAPVEVLALFKDRAMVRAAGAERLLRVGETSAEGVTLLQADATGARVRFQGREYPLSLSRQVASNFTPAERQRLAIAPDGFGQYRVRGVINESYVNFLVDTGASVVALSQRHAQSLRLDYRNGQPGRVQTAQGTASAYLITLNQVRVGGILAHNVQAAVIEGDYPEEVLLGMSFLRQVSLQEQAGVLTLIQNF